MTARAFAVVALFAGFASGVSFAQAAGRLAVDGDRPGGFGKLKSLDADHDGAVTADEFAKGQKERFVSRDTDKDGQLGPDEVVFTRGGKSGSPDRGDRFVKRYDTSADGRVTKEEFETGQRAWFAKRDKDGDGKIGKAEAPRFFARRGGKLDMPSLATALERGAAKFKAMDVNGDGAVEASEVAAAENERRAYRIKKAMHRLDQNRDGKVSPEEFMAPAQQRFGNLDLDNDGRITAEDLPPQARLQWKAP